MPLPPSLRPRLFLVDASGYIFRAFHAIPRNFKAPDGTPTNAVYGFAHLLLKLLNDERPTHLAMVFDMGRTTFRNTIYPEYKANRLEPPEELRPQFALVRDLCRAFGLPPREAPDFEADDLIATFADQATRAGWEVVVVSIDKDLCQIVNDHVALYDPDKEGLTGPSEVLARWGVAPERMVDLLALMGDSSDNIPGVPKVGEKTAAQLLSKFGDLDTLLADPAAIEKSGIRSAAAIAKTVAENVDKAKLSRLLATVRHDAPVVFDPDALRYGGPNLDALRALLSRLGIRTLRGLESVIVHYGGPEALGNSGGERSERPPEEMEAGEGNSPPPQSADTIDPPGAEPPAPEEPAHPPFELTAPGTGVKAGKTGSDAVSLHDPAAVEAAEALRARFRTITDAADLDRVVERIRAVGRFAFDTETTSLHPVDARIVGFSLAWAPGEAVYVPLAHRRSDGSFVPGQLPLEDALPRLRALLSDATLVKMAQNWKFDMAVLAGLGLEVSPPWEDTLLMSYVQGTGRRSHGLDRLALELLGHPMLAYETVTGRGKKQVTFDMVDIPTATRYAAEDAEVVVRLADLLMPGVKEAGVQAVYDTIDKPVVPVLVHMERAGVHVDKAALDRLSAELDTKMRMLEEKIHAEAGEPFNVASPVQLEAILFDKLKLPVGKKTAKGGRRSTDADELDRLKSLHPLPGLLLDHRQAAKLKGTYTEALAQLISPLTGRIHTHYQMTIAVTGRLSSTDPNLQNIPIRTEEGRRIRAAFTAEPGNVMMSADYSQIELRLLAHVARDAAMIEAFRQGADIHAFTAMTVFGVDRAHVTADMRRAAKGINFGIVYGQTVHGLAEALGISRGEAKTFMDGYFAKYPGIRGYMDRTIAQAKANGFVTTPHGRRIPIPDIRSTIPSLRAAAERAAINAPIQGGAADLVKRAMTRLFARMRSEGWINRGVRMLLQVHDELVFELPAPLAKDFATVVKTEMEAADEWAVPILVEVGTGANWDEAH